MGLNECRDFLSVAKQFKLGGLQTEQPHPLTVDLSRLATSDLESAVSTLEQVDVEALEKLGNYATKIADLGSEVSKTLTSGNRIYLCGCGATGRLSISLEVFCREGLIPDAHQEQVIGFMAGGDAALIKSIENFEDHPECGAQQLRELGFGKNDLLISTTEGGETPFVIGATEEAARISSKRPWFLYCNPETQLKEIVERSANILNNDRIRSLSLHVGPMALSGSTRMQASTVLMAAVGFALERGGNEKSISERICQLKAAWMKLDTSQLKNFTAAEANAYQSREEIIYLTDTLGVTVLTDTTERSPTFSLAPFENARSPSNLQAMCYMAVPSASKTQEAWHKILKRAPRCLEWDSIKELAGLEILEGFTIARTCQKIREQNSPSIKQIPFSIETTTGGFRWEFKELVWNVSLRELTVLEQNLILKMLLNIHSTLVMGILGRFESNLMIYVKPSNYKLIDRSIRYIQLLSKAQGYREPEYSVVAEKLFEINNSLGPDSAIVLKTLEKLDLT
tara:strand:+ start:1262 stop:2794 length:1533 start_codon:yes stop_codon:yes gene_type:complete